MISSYFSALLLIGHGLRPETHTHTHTYGNTCFVMSQLCFLPCDLFPLGRVLAPAHIGGDLFKTNLFNLILYSKAQRESSYTFPQCSMYTHTVYIRYVIWQRSVGCLLHFQVTNYLLLA